MKYSSTNKPLVCMQTQSTCYKGTTTMTPVGVLWHSTGANNTTLKRYIQPSDIKPAADTYSKEKWLEVLGTNIYGNDWNHIEHQAGLNGWIGKLANGAVTTVQTMPWNYKPWGCGSGSKGSCNSGWIQFEICEDNLTDKEYFNAVYQEACDLTAYLCLLYNIDPHGTVTKNGVKIPTILCHQDSYKLGFGGNHGDVLHWFPKHGKTMEDVRNDVSKLIADSTLSAEVKTYEVLINLPTYSTAEDAKAKTNKKNNYPAGTYYIYTKYPDGLNGMLNITKDKTGKTAGAWINPAENKKLTEETSVQKLYRVRKSWLDAESQKGAYTSLENAKACCQTAGAGYKVYDWDGYEVYSYVAQEVTGQPVTDKNKDTTTVPSIAVYDLEYPQKHPIIENNIAITLNKELCTKAIVAIIKNNSNFDVNIAKAFFTLAPIYKINPMRAIAQSILETGWFKFAGSSVKANQNNYCGLGAVGGGAGGAAFDTVEDGVKAQLQHLYAYGCKDNLPTGEAIVDPRFACVTRGIATYWEQLAGRWAVPGYEGNDAEASMKSGTTYGQKIAKIYDSLNDTEVSEEQISSYFGSSENAVENEQEKQLDIEKVNFVLGLLEKVLKFIVNFFTK